jgi:pimeloyl-ACP methyl ester carboxylesterase
MPTDTITRRSVGQRRHRLAESVLRPTHADRQRRGFLRLPGGTRLQLHYTDRGAGRPVVFVHTWQAAAQQWAVPAQALQHATRVITYDHRGHGRSDDSPVPVTVPVLADDLDQLLTSLNLSGVTLVGHSMGCAVIWAYLQQFGDERVAQLVVVDQSPAMLINPERDQETAARAGGMFTQEQLHAIVARLIDPKGREQFIRDLATDMAGPGSDRRQIEQLVTWGMRVDAQYGTALLLDHAQRDWRPQIAAITLPTLAVAGRASIVPWAGSQWIADTIPGARLEIVEADEGGSHLLTLRNPDHFIRLLCGFMA